METNFSRIRLFQLWTFWTTVACVKWMCNGAYTLVTLSTGTLQRAVWKVYMHAVEPPIQDGAEVPGCTKLSAGNALRLLCTAEKVSPERAMELKLVDEVVSGASSAAISNFVEPFDAIASAVSHGAKRVINHADDVNLDDVLEYEHGVFKTLWGGPAYLEALEKALTKKK